MKVVAGISDMKNLSCTFEKAGRTVGLVPTMGALHKGHLSLLSLAKKHCDIAVMSLFVNPAQFGPHEDFERYPRRFEDDCRLAEEAGCDALFCPSRQDMYPKDFSTHLEVEKLSDMLEGASRPGHFRGVATVVLKLFNIVAPHVAVFGQKDGQQCIVIKRMVKDLHVPVKLLFGATVREPDGLAMSSRNEYLSPGERADAPLVFAGLSAAQSLYDSGEKKADRLHGAVMQVLEKAKKISVEYVRVVDADTFVQCPDCKTPVMVAAAVRTRDTQTRLIDNIVLGGTL
jgi:pantoate--beta-alanine ligase